MSLKVFTISQCEEWDKAVRSFSQYDVYWLSGYVKAFQLHGDGEPFLFYYDDGKIRGINVVMKRDIADDERFKGKIERNNWFDFSTPYGYGGWLIEGLSEKENLFKCYIEWCLDNNIVSEFVRFHPVLHNYTKVTDVYDIVELGKTISIDLTSPECIWENFTSKNRNMIRKALKSGVTIYNGRYPEIYSKFQEIYNQTMDNDHADAYYYFRDDFYTSIMNDLSNEGQVFFAEKDGTIIAVSIILAANGKLNYHLSGSVKEYQNLAPTNLLLYKAALWGYVNGCTSFHLGGGVGGKDDSLYSFKSAFYRKEPCCFCIGRKIYNNQAYKYLLNLRNIDSQNSISYFPLYRAKEV